MQPLLVVGPGILTALLAVTDWRAVVRLDHGTRRWSKPATLAALVVVAVALGALGHASGWWLLAGLVLGFVGDVMLLDDSDHRFRLGLSAFLLGHLAYVAAFLLLPWRGPQWWAWLVVPALLACLVATRRVVPRAHRRGGAALSLPVATYTLVIGAMLVVAALTGWWVIAVGAAVFVASDSILAVDRFDRPLRHGALAVMVTYHVGQALIVLGWWIAQVA